MPARGRQRAKQGSLGRGLVNVERLWIPGSSKVDDALFAELVLAKVENLTDLAVLEIEIGFAGERPCRSILPQVQPRLGLARGGRLRARPSRQAHARELVGDPIGDDG